MRPMWCSMLSTTQVFASMSYNPNHSTDNQVRRRYTTDSAGLANPSGHASSMSRTGQPMHVNMPTSTGHFASSGQIYSSPEAESILMAPLPYTGPPVPGRQLQSQHGNSGNGYSISHSAAESQRYVQQAPSRSQVGQATSGYAPRALYMPGQGTRAQDIAYERMQQVMYTAPALDGPDPNFRISTRLRDSYLKLLELSRQSDTARSLRNLDKEIVKVVQSIQKLKDVATLAIPCHKQIEDVINFYGNNPNAAIEPGHPIHSKLSSIVEVLPEVARTVNKLIQSLTERADSLGKLESVWPTATLAIRLTCKLATVITNIFSALIPLHRSTAIPLHVATAVSEVWNGAESSFSAGASGYDRLQRESKQHVDSLLNSCRLFLMCLDEVDHHMVRLHTNRAYFNLNPDIQKSINAYLVNFEFEITSITHLMNTDAYVAAQMRAIPSAGQR